MMMSFDPESPWEVGQVVTVTEGGRSWPVVITTVEHSADGMESQYQFRAARIGGEQ